MLLPFVPVYTIGLDRAIYLKKPLTYEQIVIPQRMLITIAVVCMIVVCKAVIVKLDYRGSITQYDAIKM